MYWKFWVAKLKREEKTCFLLLTLGNDYRCYYSPGQMLFVLSRPSPEHCKMREREQEREKYTDRQTDCNITGASTVHEPPLYLMGILDRQRQTPLPIFHCSSGNYSGRRIAKSYVNIQHTRQLPTASESHTDLKKYMKDKQGKEGKREGMASEKGG